MIFPDHFLSEIKGLFPNDSLDKVQIEPFALPDKSAPDFKTRWAMELVRQARIQVLSK